MGFLHHRQILYRLSCEEAPYREASSLGEPFCDLGHRSAPWAPRATCGESTGLCPPGLPRAPAVPLTQRWGSLLYECEWGHEVSEFSISKLCNLWHPFFLGPWNQGSKRKLATSAREGRASAAGALGYCAHKDCASGVDILRSEGDQKIQRERRWLCTLPAWARGLWAGM